jgi:TonB family protein
VTSCGLVVAAVVCDGAMWTALGLALHGPAPRSEAPEPELAPAEERIEVSPVTAALPILDSPDLFSEGPPEVPRALAQHDHDPRQQMRRRERSGAITTVRSRRSRALSEAAAPVPVTGPEGDSSPAAPDPPAAVNAAAQPLPLVQGSDDVPPDLPEGPRTAVATLASPLAEYLDRIRRAVRMQWRPSEVYRRVDPDGALAAVTAGMTVLRVRIRADGSVEPISVDTPSGLAALDREAVEAFQRAQPFGAPPLASLDDAHGLSFRFGLYLDLSLARFMSVTSGRLKQTWSPPPRPRSGPFREVAVARVRLRADGSMAEAIIELSSGREALNQSALEALRRVAFPAPAAALRIAGGLAQVRIAFVTYARGNDELRFFRHPPDPRVLLGGSVAAVSPR